MQASFFGHDNRLMKQNMFSHLTWIGLLTGLSNMQRLVFCSGQNPCVVQAQLGEKSLKVVESGEILL